MCPRRVPKIGRRPGVCPPPACALCARLVLRRRCGRAARGLGLKRGRGGVAPVYRGPRRPGHPLGKDGAALRPAELVAEVADMMRRTERAWGKSFEEVAELWGRDVDTLAYRCMMQTIGHGIGPDDDGDFPEDIDPSPLYVESPAHNYTPEVGDWTGIEDMPKRRRRKQA